MANGYFRAGTKVTGKYYDVAFTGIVTEFRPHTIHPTRVEHTVKLDQPITVFSRERDTIIVATCDNNERYCELSAA